MMAYIQFDKAQLINLRFSLCRELLRVNSRGAYASSTVTGCHTRKYHGILVAPQPQIDEQHHVLLSSLDETIIEQEAPFHLALHKYPFIYQPRGHKYLREFSIDPVPKWIYRVGGIVLAKEMLLEENEVRALLRYEILEAPGPVTMQFQPYLAFRGYHSLSKANTYVNKKYRPVANGIRWRPYENYDPLILQFNRKVEYIANPEWFYNLEFLREQQRGYGFKEDLFVPGFFETVLKKGQLLVIAAGLEEVNPRGLSKRFAQIVASRPMRKSMSDFLKDNARQFIMKTARGTEVVAGWHWFGRWGRDTFIALPGLTLVTGKPDTCLAVLKTMVSQLKDGLFPNMGHAYNSVDAPLWFFWTLQQYIAFTGQHEQVWRTFGATMKTILQAYRSGTKYGIRMDGQGLIEAGKGNMALTWMDAVVDGQPVTPRHGMPVEINALWYNAVCFAIELAERLDDRDFVAEWKGFPEQIAAALETAFWSEEKGYLADVATAGKTDWTMRPNQVFATSLPHSPVNAGIREAVLEKVWQELLTPRGLRTLSPRHPSYRGTYEGDQRERDRAYHQGTVWPWLLGHFVEGYLKTYEQQELKFV